jgi:hypothetical protein
MKAYKHCKHISKQQPSSILFTVQYWIILPTYSASPWKRFIINMLDNVTISRWLLVHISSFADNLLHWLKICRTVIYIHAPIFETSCRQLGAGPRVSPLIRKSTSQIRLPGTGRPDAMCKDALCHYDACGWSHSEIILGEVILIYWFFSKTYCGMR